MPLIVTNNNQVTLGVALTDTDTTMTVSSVVGLPDVSAPTAYTILTIVNEATSAIEYVRCTDLDALNKVYTIERAREGTLAQAFPLGASVRNFFTAGMFTELANSASSALKKTLHTIDNTLSVSNPAGENSELLVLAKYGNQLIEGTDYELVDGGDTVNFLGTQAIEGEEVTFVYTGGVLSGTNIEDMPSTENDTTKVLRPNGAGGVSWVQDNSGLSKRIVVRSSSDFGTIDPTAEYFIDGVVDMGTTSIEVPAGGVNIRGFNLSISKLISTENNYTMFTSPVGGSGNVFDLDVSYEVSGTNSTVYALTDATGFNAFEHTRVNWDNCTSLGYIDGYRQGLEVGTGRFGGTPELELRGTWLGGYKSTTTIVRSLTDGAYTLFKAGAGFSMNSRFFSDVNADLNSTISLLDFSGSNFPNPSTLQLQNCEVTRNGVRNSSDITLIPNITAGNVASAFTNNKGLPNTFVGGSTAVSSESVTTINTIDVFEDVAGTFATGSLVHFDSPSAGQLRHLADDPREYRVTVSASVEGIANDTLKLKLTKWDDSASIFEDQFIQTRPVNNLQGGRDFAYFDLVKAVDLDVNDYVKLEVTNTTSTNDVTMELDSYLLVEER